MESEIVEASMDGVELVENDDHDEPRASSRDSIDHFINTHKKARASTIAAQLMNRFQKMKDKMPVAMQLLLLYLSLGILAGCGGVMFKLFEYETEQDELDRRIAIWQDIQANGNFTEAELAVGGPVRKWADEYAQLFTDANKWEFRYCVFFAATTFTTCGFGLQAPNTVFGRAMVIFWGLPAIMIYGVMARKIGGLCMYFIQKAVLKSGVSRPQYLKNRLKWISLFFFAGFMGMSMLIWQTATDEGFGEGIYSLFDAIYFLWTTTCTIGYGDVMMSGSNPVLTPLIGLWLACTLGMTICLAQEIAEKIYAAKKKVDMKQLKLMSLDSAENEDEVLVLPDEDWNIR